MLYIVKYCQRYLTDLPLQGDQFFEKFGQKEIRDQLIVEISFEELGARSPADYDNIKNALERLTYIHYEYDTDDYWMSGSIIERLLLQKQTSIVKFSISEIFLHSFMNFTRGYSHFILEQSLSFDSPYSSRMYEMICGTTQTTRWDIETLKTILGRYKTYSEREAAELQAKAAAHHLACHILPGMTKFDANGEPIEKYKDTSNFLKKTIEVAQKELSEKCNWTFEFVTVKEGKAIKYIDITPNPRQSERQALTTKSIEIHDKSRSLCFIPKDLRDFLRGRGWADREIRNNRGYLCILVKINGKNSASWAEDIYRRMPVVENHKGYLINTIKTEVQKVASKDYELRKYIKEAWPVIYPDISMFDIM